MKTSKFLLTALMLLALNTPFLSQAASDTQAAASGVTTSVAIDINHATAEQLAMLKGVGPSKAQAIISYRQTNGLFESVDQLTAVKGIGPKIVEMNKNQLAVQ